MAKTPGEIALSSRPIPLRHPQPDGPFVVRGHWIDQPSGAVCVGIEVWKNVEPTEDGWHVRPLNRGQIEGLGGTDLRQIPLATIIDELWKMQHAQEAATNEHVEGAGYPQLATTSFDERRPRQRRVDPADAEHFRQVAAVYLEAMASPGRKRPTLAVQNRWTVKYSTATKWVQRARDFGFLPETTSGRPAGTPTKTRKATRR